jgi:membrane fusion protein, copper/silver efflux system
MPWHLRVPGHFHKEAPGANMRRVRQAGLILLIGAAAFAAGMSMRSSDASKSKPGAILYYVDPMHPSYKSDKPGTAPDCGMRLEPVYADGSGGTARPRPGTIHITAAQQQLIGLRTGTPATSRASSVLRTVGRVTADERRVYRINAAVDGWIREVLQNTTGSRVRKDEYLASMWAPELYSPQQAYVFELGVLDRYHLTGNEMPQQLAAAKTNIDTAADALRGFGMSEKQIEELGRSRQPVKTVYITAPASGVIVARNASPGLRFEKGTELYRIADLSHVWLIADLFQGDVGSIRPGQRAKVTTTSKSAPLTMMVSSILPQLDPVTRTLKVRLEVDNPDLILRPEMFVDVEFETETPGGLSVAADAVVDAGTRKVVFIDLGDGYYEPRKVETGWRTADRVEITHGLNGDERIVTSGNFLLDSESRLKLGETVTSIDSVTDPACGMTVDPVKATKAGLHLRIRDKDYYFCSAGCRDSFERDARRSAAASARERRD